MPKPVTKTMPDAPFPARVDRTRSPSVVAWNTNAVEWCESPARQLHERLVATFASPPVRHEPDGLSARAKLGILTGASAGLWCLIGLAIHCFA